MNIRLTPEQISALRLNPTGVEFTDDSTDRAYFLVDAEIHRRALQALQRENDHHAIREGISNMEAGGGMTLQEADSKLRENLGFPPRSD